MVSAIELDKKRKHSFFCFCSTLLLFIFIFLAFMNYKDGLLLDFDVDLVIITVCIGSLIAIRCFARDMTIYRVTYAIVCGTFFFSVSIGVGKETIFYYIFAMPPLLFFYFGKREGIVWITIFIFVIGLIMLNPWAINLFKYEYFHITRFFITIAIVIITSYGMESARFTFSQLLDQKNRVLHQEKQQLEKALRDIKTLTGLIPICANCKKVRNDKGYWQQVETYMHEHAQVDFSHGICPDCIKILYPELHSEASHT